MENSTKKEDGGVLKKQFNISSKKIVIPVIIILLLFSYNVINYIGNSASSSAPAEVSESNQTARNSSTAGQAYIISQTYVKAILKSPSTADFSLLDYQSFDLGKDKYKIVSYVDSQNGFGAMIRSNYSAVLLFKGGDWSHIDNWTLEELTFDGEVIFEN